MEYWDVQVAGGEEDRRSSDGGIHGGRLGPGARGGLHLRRLRPPRTRLLPPGDREPPRGHPQGRPRAAPLKAHHRHRLQVHPHILLPLIRPTFSAPLYLPNN